MLNSKLLIPFVLLFTILSCGPSDEEILQVWSDTRVAAPDPFAGLTAFEKEHGIGPVKEKVKLDPLNNALATKGQKVFENKCYACHRVDSKLVGPALGDVLNRRQPEFVLNMMLNPEGMIQKHPEAKKLFAQFLIQMANQNLSQEEARSILEYLRKTAKKS